MTVALLEAARLIRQAADQRERSESMRVFEREGVQALILVPMDLLLKVATATGSNRALPHMDLHSHDGALLRAPHVPLRCVFVL